MKSIKSMEVAAVRVAPEKFSKVIRTKAVPRKPTPNTKDPGFLYRGATAEVEMGGYKVRLVMDETYIVAELGDPNNIVVTLKKPGVGIKFVITPKEYAKYLVPGRNSFSDVDPYPKVKVKSFV